MFLRISRRWMYPIAWLLIASLAACGSVGATVSSRPERSEPATTSLPATQQNANDLVPSTQKELVIIGSEISASLDPVAELSAAYLRNMGAGEALFRVDAQGQLVPQLAESIEQLDARTWRVRLRPNLHFWSGAVVDAEAVRKSLERSRRLDRQAEPFLAGTTISVLDELSLQFVTEQDHQPVPLNLSYYQLLIHNADSYGEEINGFTLSAADLTGMYRIREFIPKQVLRLERNANYWGQAPSIEFIRHEEISDAQARVLAAQSGQAQIVLNIPATGVAQLQQQAGVELVAAPSSSTQTIYLNTQQALLQDVRVRQALAWALDRQELIDLAVEGQSSPLSTWLGANPAFAEAQNAVYPQADLQRANSLLDAAGWELGTDGLRSKDGQILRLRLMTWGDDKALGEVLQSQWRRIGVQLELEHGDYSLIQTAREQGDWDASIEAWSTFGSPYALLAGQFAPDGRANYGKFADPQVLDLLERLAASSDAQEQHAVALQLNAYVAEQAPSIALYARPQLTAVHESLSGFMPHFRQFENVVHADLALEP